jgi:hypothetical protein
MRYHFLLQPFTQKIHIEDATVSILNAAAQSKPSDSYNIIGTIFFGCIFVFFMWMLVATFAGVISSDYE